MGSDFICDKGVMTLEWSIVRQAIDDVMVLKRNGIITPDGKVIGEWPKERVGGKSKHMRSKSFQGYTGKAQVERLLYWWRNHAEETLDAIGCTLPVDTMLEKMGID